MKKIVASVAILGLLLAGCATSSKEQAPATKSVEQSVKISPDERAKRAEAAQNLSGQNSPSKEAQEQFEKFLVALDKKDFATAKASVDRACELAHGEACYADGQLHLRAGNLDAAKGRFERACGLNHKFACAQLGVVLLNLGQTQAGLNAMDKACQMGDGLACGNLGGLYSGLQPNVKKDAVKSKAYYAKACKLGIEQTNAKVDFCELAK